MTQPHYFRGYFVRQVLNDIKDSLFQDIKDRIASNSTLNWEDFKINEATYSLVYKPTGNKIISKGISKDGSRTAKMKSLAGATHVLIEEADEIGETDFDQLDLSLRTTKTDHVEIVRIFNPPPRQHWIWRDYNLVESEVEGWFHAQPKSTSDLVAVFSTYHDNIENLQESTIAKFKGFEETNIEYYYNQVLGLISDGAKGRIYSDWRPIPDVDYNALDLQEVYVMDFGYSADPTALVSIKWEKTTRYMKELLYEPHLDNLALARRMTDLGIKEDSLIVADPGNGGDLRVAELRRGIYDPETGKTLRFANIRLAIKGAGSINVGIGMVKSTVTYMTEGSENGWEEFYEYKWRLDADKNPTDTPMDAFNHIMDCRRYFELAKGKIF